jgi:hypothetical protein
MDCFTAGQVWTARQSWNLLIAAPPTDVPVRTVSFSDLYPAGLRAVQWRGNDNFVPRQQYLLADLVTCSIELLAHGWMLTAREDGWGKNSKQKNAGSVSRAGDALHPVFYVPSGAG